MSSAKRVSRLGRHRKARPHHQIEIFVHSIEQLFNSMDPSPFHEKDLDRDAEEFIASWAQEYPVRDPLTLVIHLDRPEPGADPALSIRAGIHNYFAYRRKLNRLALSHLCKQGRTSLVIGLVFLAACLLTSELLATVTPQAFRNLARESLTIAGWVAMWRPMQVFLYDWWPLVRLDKIFRKLSHMPVELRFREAS